MIDLALGGAQGLVSKHRQAQHLIATSGAVRGDRELVARSRVTFVAFPHNKGWTSAALDWGGEQNDPFMGTRDAGGEL